MAKGKRVEPEDIIKNGIHYNYFYSKDGFYILKVGTSEKYVDAIDLKTSTFEYEETDEPIEEQTDGE